MANQRALKGKKKESDESQDKKRQREGAATALRQIKRHSMYKGEAGTDSSKCRSHSGSNECLSFFKNAYHKFDLIQLQKYQLGVFDDLYVGQKGTSFRECISLSSVPTILQ